MTTRFLKKPLPLESTYSIKYFNDFLWVGGTEGRMYSSADGVSWTPHETPAVQSNLVAVSATDSMLLAHGFSASLTVLRLTTESGRSPGICQKDRY